MRIGIIGAGKVGTALGYSLREKGFDIAAVADVSPASLETARRYIGEGCVYTDENRRVVELSDVIAVTTQDREIKNVAARLFDEAVRLDGKLFFHTSGAQPSWELSPLEERGALLGSLHPLQTFPDIDSGIGALPGTYIFIEGDEKAIPTLRLLAGSIGAEVVAIESEKKVLYHLSAVFVCNLLSALLYCGEGVMGRIGIDLKPFHPIIRATLANIEAKGALLALTGPVVRGDAGTVSSHLAALQGMGLAEKVYRDLSLVALEMARERGAIGDDEIEALKGLLQRYRLTARS